MDHDLRHDQEAEDAATHARLRCNTTWFAGSDTASMRLEPSQLRTVPMPELRSPAAREQDAQVRGMRYLYFDTRTADERTTAELVRLVDAVQALRLEFDVLREELRAGRL